MPTLQGHLPDTAAAEQAVELLTRAGVPKDRIRCWNSLPEAAPEHTSDANAFRGAVVGGLIAGAAGLAAGAATGASLDEAERGSPRRSASSGVLVAVDTAPGGPDVAALLQQAGARDVNTLSY